MSNKDYKVDVLVFGPHPDDAEIGVGGLLLSMHAAGRTSAIVDMTEGESARRVLLIFVILRQKKQGKF